MKKLQNVTIKGTKEGISLHLNDSCSFDELKKELQMKLRESSHSQVDHQLITVKVQLGNRYLTAEKIEELKSIIIEELKNDQKKRLLYVLGKIKVKTPWDPSTS